MSNNKWKYTYHPKTLDEMILSESVRGFFSEMIKTQNLRDMTLYGIQGIGKSTIAELLIKEFNAVSLVVDCGTDGGIDVMRNRVDTFCNSETIDDRIKVVLLDEADQLSGGDLASSAQGSLRTIMNKAPDVVFILTCNYVNKISGPILSRCTPINIKHNSKEILARIRQIMDAESVTYDKESLKVFVEDVVKPTYPDIRGIISQLQNCCIDGKLTAGVVDDISEADALADAILKMITDKTKPTVIRSHVLQNRGVFNDDFARFATIIFNKVVATSDVKTLRMLTHQLYKIEQVSDPEIQFFGFILELI